MYITMQQHNLREYNHILMYKILSFYMFRKTAFKMSIISMWTNKKDKLLNSIFKKVYHFQSSFVHTLFSKLTENVSKSTAVFSCMFKISFFLILV